MKNNAYFKKYILIFCGLISTYCHALNGDIGTLLEISDVKAINAINPKELHVEGNFAIFDGSNYKEKEIEIYYKAKTDIPRSVSITFTNKYWDADYANNNTCFRPLERGDICTIKLRLKPFNELDLPIDKRSADISFRLPEFTFNNKSFTPTYNGKLDLNLLILYYGIDITTRFITATHDTNSEQCPYRKLPKSQQQVIYDLTLIGTGDTKKVNFELLRNKVFFSSKFILPQGMTCSNMNNISGPGKCTINTAENFSSDYKIIEINTGDFLAANKLAASFKVSPDLYEFYVTKGNPNVLKIGDDTPVDGATIIGFESNPVPQYCGADTAAVYNPKITYCKPLQGKFPRIGEVTAIKKLPFEINVKGSQVNYLVAISQNANGGRYQTMYGCNINSLECPVHFDWISNMKYDFSSISDPISVATGYNIYVTRKPTRNIDERQTILKYTIMPNGQTIRIPDEIKLPFKYAFWITQADSVSPKLINNQLVLEVGAWAKFWGWAKPGFRVFNCPMKGHDEADCDNSNIFKLPIGGDHSASYVKFPDSNASIVIDKSNKDYCAAVYDSSSNRLNPFEKKIAGYLKCHYTPDKLVPVTGEPYQGIVFSVQNFTNYGSVYSLRDNRYGGYGEETKFPGRKISDLGIPFYLPDGHDRAYLPLRTQ
jgi:hypothetical protein